MAALQKQVDRLDTLTPGSEQYNLTLGRIKQSKGYVEQSVENYRDAIDFETDRAAMIAGIIATALVIVLTAGAAAPLVAAAAAVAGATATIVTKQLMKGSAYTRSELITDIVVGAVDAIVSAATAGLGGKLLRLGPLAKLAKSSSLAPRLFAHGLAEGVENFIQAVPTAIVTQLMDKRSQGLSFEGIFTAGAMGFALGGTLGSIGGFKKPLTKAATESADILASRGTAVERLVSWKAFSEANPGKSYKQFLAELDAGVLARQADEEAVRQAQRNMRRELLTDIPPAQRGQFKDTPIRVLSDEEFDRFTRSATGQAVVVIEQGKPTVLLRESADIGVLRQEGIHLLQSVDPSKAHLFRALDERVLSKWDTLSLDEQLNLYGKKLDLELDGQRRLIKNLESQLAAAGEDGPARARILAQLEDARHTLDNLSKRFDEVADLTPTKRADIVSGKAAKPDYLDQPARLFAKEDRELAKSKIFAKLAGEPGAARAKAVLDELLDAAHGVKTGTAAFDAVSRKVGRMAPKEAAAFLDQIGKVVDAVPKGARTADVSGFIVAATKRAQRPGFIGEVAGMLTRLKQQKVALPRQTLRDVGHAVSEMEAQAAGRYVRELDGFVARGGRDLDLELLDGFVLGASQAKDPGAYLRLVDNLNARRLSGDISREAVETLARKAGAGVDTFDLEWLGRTRLFSENSKWSNRVLEFLALDPQTPWNSFKLVASVDPKGIKNAFKNDSAFRNAVNTSRNKIRGAAGELLAQQELKAMLEAEGLDLAKLSRQVQLEGTISDFVAELLGGVRQSIEVKSFGKSFWENFRAAGNKLRALNEAAREAGKKFDRAAAVAKLPKRQQHALDAYEHLLKQVAEAEGRPIVVLSDIIRREKGLNFLEARIRKEIPQALVLFLDEEAIRAFSGKMRGLMGIIVQ
jgi:hypothetical protein